MSAIVHTYTNNNRKQIMYYKDIYYKVTSMLDDEQSPMEIAEALNLDFQTVLDIQQDFESVTMRAYG